MKLINNKGQVHQINLISRGCVKVNPGENIEFETSDIHASELRRALKFFTEEAVVINKTKSYEKPSKVKESEPVDQITDGGAD